MEKHIYRDVNFRGTIKRIEYSSVNSDNEQIEKYANVYLPYGYDSADSEKRYNILYLMHGGGGSADAWLDCSWVKNMLDCSIHSGKVEPLIVVFPTYYNEINPIVEMGKIDTERQRILFFQKELVHNLIPAVESQFHTYADTVTEDGLKASRMHRGFGGFSMGGGTTWYAFTHNLDYFSTFIPLSGDCWELEVQGGRTRSDETAKLLYNHVKTSGYAIHDYYIYAATGTKDIAYDALTAQIEAMRKFADVFVEHEDYSKGNFHYLIGQDEVHSYEAVCDYLFNFLPFLFR